MAGGKSKKNRGLGRGLEALFADQAPVLENASKKLEETSAENKDSVQYIAIDEIRPNTDQPRKEFDPEKIRELADSIVEHGIIQPLIVRKSGEFYELVAGERRWRAARVAELKKVPCLIREFSDEENVLVTVIENMQREDLNPIEEANGLDQMMRQYGMTQAQVSKSIGKSRPYIANSLRLLKLPEGIQDLVRTGQISMGHARALITIDDPKFQQEIAERIVKEGLSVRDVEKLAQQKGKKRPKPRKRVKSPDVVRAENRLKDIYGTKVTIVTGSKKGRIELEYYSQDELNRLLDLLMEEQLQ